MKKRLGSSLLLVLMMLTVVAPMAIAVGALTIIETRSSSRLADSTAAYYAAEAGIEESLLAFKNKTLASVPTAKQNLTTYGANCTSSDRCYTVGITNSVPEVGSVSRINEVGYTGNPTLKKDNSIEIDLGSMVTKPANIEFAFHSTTGTVARDLPALCGQANPPAYCRYRIEVTYLLSEASSEGQRFTHGMLVRDDENIPILLSRDATTLSGTQVWGTVDKVRIKPTYGDISYAYRGVNGQVPAQTISIKSTGEYSQTKRTLEAKLDRNSGSVIGLFDFVIYAGNELKK